MSHQGAVIHVGGMRVDTPTFTFIQVLLIKNKLCEEKPHGVMSF